MKSFTKQNNKEKIYPYLASRNNKNILDLYYTVLFTAPSTGMVVHMDVYNDVKEILKVGYYATDWNEEEHFDILPPTTVIELSN